MAPRSLAEAAAAFAAVWAPPPPLSVPSASDVRMASTSVAGRRSVVPPVAWVACNPVAPTEDLLDDYLQTAHGVGADGETVEGIDGPPERIADIKCSLDLPPEYSEEQYPLATAGTSLRQDRRVDNVEDGAWVSSPGTNAFLDEPAVAIDSEVQGEQPVDMKPREAHTPGVGSVDMALRRLHRVAAVEATNRYENGPGRRVPPAPQASEVELALGDRRRSVLARKALKKRSAYTSRFKKVVYEELLEAELKARQARLDAVLAERNVLLGSVGLLRAAAAAAEEKAAAEAATRSSATASPAVSVPPTATAELSLVGSPTTPSQPAAKMVDSAVDDMSAGTTAPSQPPLFWSTFDKEGPGRWALDASLADDRIPIWEDTCEAAHAA